ncbi:MAG: tRNA (adenosine(37)-N6)-dimethylallyltransferase MiaA [Planctomycetota bacterium]|jgi:tRNA dimethylallyltransferase|nr:tRNA (adenosine(37)-N6)-dimethylallyltransferase MiaA [Planctomycetota bacterium]
MCLYLYNRFSGKRFTEFRIFLVFLYLPDHSAVYFQLNETLFNMDLPDRTLFIVGTTASGKDAVAHSLACRLGGEILCMDSMKVYRGLDAGTSKPEPEDRATCTYHLLDIIDPWEEFDVASYLTHALEISIKLNKRNIWSVFCGGTFLYLKALLRGLVKTPGQDPTLRESLEEEARVLGSPTLHQRLVELDPLRAQQIHPNDLKRIVRALEVQTLTGQPMSSHFKEGQHHRFLDPYTVIGIRRTPEDLENRIRLRTAEMLSCGLVEETRSLLHQAPKGFGPRTQLALGYRQVLEMLNEQKPLTDEDLLEQIIIQTRQLARSQRKWTRQFPEILWLDVNPDETPSRTADTILERIKKTPPIDP